MAEELLRDLLLRGLRQGEHRGRQGRGAFGAGRAGGLTGGDPLAPGATALEAARLRPDWRAARLFTAEGELLVLREDVGRHNAVDKAIGRALIRSDVLDRAAILQVSGRASFELVQKALVAGIPIVTAVSAPSSLAVRLAGESNMTLVGFLRETGFNVYAGEGRLGSGISSRPRPAGARAAPKPRHPVSPGPGARPVPQGPS